MALCDFCCLAALPGLLDQRRGGRGSWVVCPIVRPGALVDRILLPARFELPIGYIGIGTVFHHFTFLARDTFRIGRIRDIKRERPPPRAVGTARSRKPRAYRPTLTTLTSLGRLKPARRSYRCLIE